MVLWGIVLFHQHRVVAYCVGTDGYSCGAREVSMTLEQVIAWCMEHTVELSFDTVNSKTYVVVYRSVDYGDELMGDGATIVEAAEHAREKWESEGVNDEA